MFRISRGIFFTKPSIKCFCYRLLTAYHLLTAFFKFYS